WLANRTISDCRERQSTVACTWLRDLQRDVELEHHLTISDIRTRFRTPPLLNVNQFSKKGFQFAAFSANSMAIRVRHVACGYVNGMIVDVRSPPDERRNESGRKTLR